MCKWRLHFLINAVKQLKMFCIIGLVTSLMVLTLQIRATPLDDYVNAPDPHYKWVKLDWEYKGPDFTLYVINMTSQKWLTEDESNHPIWWHYIYIAVPDLLTRPEAGLLYISSGSNNDNFEPDLKDDFIQFITLMAVSTGSVCANLRQVPNQPIVFKNDPSQANRSEDEVIAWTWYQYVVQNKSAEWLLRLPMTKAAVRAMDTVAAFTKTLFPAADVSKFLVCGKSKRGWTTWTTGAIDKRVVAIVPMVMDLLNMVQNLHHHYQSLGGWTFEFYDYYTLNFTACLDHPNTQSLANIVDGFSYRDRLTMPKYIISAGGDEFFLPDDSYYFYDQLPGETFLRTIPNADHSLDDHSISLFLGVRSFYLSVIDNITRPKMTWSKNFSDTEGTLTMYTDVVPLEVNVHFAKTLDGERRDFRLEEVDPDNPDKTKLHPVVWETTSAEKTNDREYFIQFKNPSVGWLAFHIQAFFPGPDGSDFEFTTENMIIPNTLPFPPCSGDGCYGKLV